MAIKITTVPTTESLCGLSHWWGFPDLPQKMEWPVRETDSSGYLLTFICQIRLEDIAEFDTKGLLPHKGLLWFFADLDYFLGDLDAPCCGTGQWKEGAFKVLYSPECSSLCTHEYYWEDGSPAVLNAEKLIFQATDDADYGQKLLGVPAMTEGYENENEGLLSLLQVDEEDRWHLRFFDCGTINFMLPFKSLRQCDFSKVSLHLHSL